MNWIEKLTQTSSSLSRQYASCLMRVVNMSIEETRLEI